jgi:hypothetical protein
MAIELRARSSSNEMEAIPSKGDVGDLSGGETRYFLGDQRFWISTQRADLILPT